MTDHAAILAQLREVVTLNLLTVRAHCHGCGMLSEWKIRGSATTCDLVAHTDDCLRAHPITVIVLFNDDSSIKPPQHDAASATCPCGIHRNDCEYHK